MGIATSTVTSIVNTGIAIGAQEARKDAIARNSIPQINQNAQSKNSNAFSQAQSQLAPEQSALYVQSDAINKVVSEREQQKHKEDKLKNEERESKEKSLEDGDFEDVNELQGVKGNSSVAHVSTSVSASGNSLDKDVTSIGVIHESASAVLGATYSEEADDRREKGNGFSSKVIASTYNAINPNVSLGRNVNVHS